MTTRILLMFSVLTLLAPGALLAGAADTAPVVRYSVEGTYENVRDDLVNAITGRGLVIDHNSHVAKMLDRTGKDLGTTITLLLIAAVVLWVAGLETSYLWKLGLAGALLALLLLTQRRLHSVACPLPNRFHSQPVLSVPLPVVARPKVSSCINHVVQVYIIRKQARSSNRTSKQVC